jgi:serine phosphatase RsbU (regulator of sigma subunit)
LSLYSTVSYDGITWNSKVNVTGNLPFNWDQKVSLFSMIVDENGQIVIVFAESEHQLSVYRSVDKGQTYEKVSEIISESAIVAPRLFLKKSGGLILFATQKADLFLEGMPSTLSIYYTETEGDSNWGPLTRFIDNDDLLQSFLPNYTNWNGKEYVVFQAILRGSGINFQLYMKKRDSATGAWSDSELLTDFNDPRYPDISYNDFSNQRPFLLGVDDHLSLVWERNEFGLNSQVYYARMDEEGNFISDVDIVSDDFRISAFPQIQVLNGEEILLWFDNRDGNKIILAQKRGLFWDEEIVSSINGESTYGQLLPFKSAKGEDQLLIAWENIFGNRNRTVLLSPDQTVNTPGITPINFTRGRRSSEEFPVFIWTEPQDSSFIRGYSYLWTRDPEENPPQKLDLRGDPLRRRASFQATEEGLWYFKVIAEDYALNWSEPKVETFFYDITPPKEVVFFETPTDSFGYALSNTFDIEWQDPPDEDISRYLYQVSYLGSDILDSAYTKISYSTAATAVNLNKKVTVRNYDNGYWGITVFAEDSAGNRSRPSLQVFRLNKYIPVTYISNVISVVDDLLRPNLTIRGRGFSTQGKVTSVIIDSDGKFPWDYQFTLDNDDYFVTDDRNIADLIIDDIEGGIYNIGVEHPRRGIVFARNQLNFESTGVVKFGDFSTDYQSIWDVVPYNVRSIPGNLILAISVLIFLAMTMTFTTFKLVQIGREVKDFTYNSKALFEGTLLTEELKKERLKTMKRKGLGLRMKFLLALLSLVISVILMIAISLGLYMIDSQKRNLANSMKQRAELLLETQVSGAQNSLQLTGLDRRLGLIVIPGQRTAMNEAAYTTITGVGQNDPGVFNHIWATDDANISRKFKLPDTLIKSNYEKALEGLSVEDQDILNSVYSDINGDIQLNSDVAIDTMAIVSALLVDAGIIEPYSVGGEKQISDNVTASLQEIEKTINEQGADIVGDIPAQIAELNRKGIQLAVSGASPEEVNLINDDIRVLSEQLKGKLKEIGNITKIYPEFIPEQLNRDQLNYIFYRPIVYEDSTSETYYRGAVRLGVSVELILDEIDKIIINLIRITVFISLAALALGVVGALILASTMINPIKKLVQGVERIRDTENKAHLEGQEIKVKSKDELSELADTINDMAKGLVKAAIASQQVTLGAEIQKKFVRLEPVPSGEERKLPTGQTESEYADFYGYYKGAKEVSGDYFNYKQIDENHYACIKCDISGKDIPASLLMVVVATVFDNYCKNLNLKRDGIHLNKMVEDVNDLYDQLNFKGKFAAFTIILINIKTGKTWMSNAGDNVLHYFNASKRAMDSLTLQKAPAAGPFPTDLVNMQGGFKQETHTFNREDILFLFTDGIEESQRDFRNTKLEKIKCEGCDFAGVDGVKENRDTDTHVIGAEVEELGLVRIDAILNAILNGQTYEIKHNHNPFPDKKLSFDFTGCDDSLEASTLGILSVDIVYRLFPDPNAGPNDRILVYRKFDDFLRKHFDQYSEYFRFPVDHPSFPEYMYYTHLKETAQYDDTTMLAIRLK